ncbi:MAG: hypothetical protein EON60_09750 [Alphaproteobacteria bacterium]|nr:MAG: hypothetical protein EON60_09750 [Alphaproteobacteria bacterium]
METTMAVPFERGENLELGFSALLDHGKVNGMQMADYRLSLMVHDNRLMAVRETSDLTIQLVEWAAEMFVETTRTPSLHGMLIQDFKDMLKEGLNERLMHTGLEVRRVIFLGWEPSVEALMGLQPPATH